MRAKIRHRVVQGDELDPEFEFEFDAAAAPAGTTHFVTAEPWQRIRLVCEERRAKRRIEVVPYDDCMLSWTSDADRHPLAGPPPAHLLVTFFLSTVWQRLRPGSYEARLEFRDPVNRKRAAGDEVDWQPPRVWTGKLSTASFTLTVDEAPDERVRFRAPTRLTLRQDASTHSIKVIYTDSDSSSVEVAVRHGFAIGLESFQDDVRRGLQSGFPEPDAASQYDWHFGFFGPERTGPIHSTYRLTLFETPDQPCHMWHPDPTGPGCRVLWSGTFTVDATAAELDALRK